MDSENKNNNSTNKTIVIRSTSKEIFNFELQYKLKNGYSFIKTATKIDEDGIWYCALLARKNDMLYKIFSI
ncbi:MAG: hypothetical protein JWR09_4392 [Mucilaginibacter sp.]|nr:hypothetical protein [Mucilaginibacter sp.]